MYHEGTIPIDCVILTSYKVAVNRWRPLVNIQNWPNACWVVLVTWRPVVVVAGVVGVRAVWKVVARDSTYYPRYKNATWQPLPRRQHLWVQVG